MRAALRAALAVLALPLLGMLGPTNGPAGTVMLGAISSVPTSGGNAFLTLSSGLQVPTCAVSNAAGTAFTPLTTTAWTSSTATLMVPPLAAGTYNLVCSNPGGEFDAEPGLLVVSSVLTPSTIFGANLVSEYLAKTAYLTCTGGCADGATVTAWADVFGTNNLTCSGGVTYHAASTHWIMPSVPIVTFDGVNGTCTQSSFALGGTTFYAMGGFYPTSSGGYLVDYTATPIGIALSSSQVELFVGGGASMTLAVPYTATNNGFVAVGGIVGASTAWSGGMSWSNGTVFTGAGTAAAALSTSDQFALGNRTGTSGYAAYETSEVDVVNTLPSGTQRTQYVSYINLTQGVDALPTLSMMTGVQAATSSAPARLQGSGFNVPTVSVQSVGALTIVDSAQTYVDVTAPSTTAGTYDTTIANPDGRSVTFNNAAVFSAPTNPTPEMVLGTQLDMWLETGFVLNGSSVATWVDLSGLGNNAVQGTSADQPSYTASDSLFANRPSVGSTGSPIYLATGTMQTSLTGTGITMCALLYETTASNGPDVIGVFNSGFNVINNETSVNTHTPFTLESGPGVWGVALAINTAYWACARKSGTGTITYGQNINNGTEATGTLSNSATYVPANTFVLSGASNGSGAPGSYWTGHVGLVVMIQGTPTSTQLAQLKAYACAGGTC